jgi:hypothetical protein
MRRLFVSLLLVCLLCVVAHAKKEKDASKEQNMVLFWPNQDNAILKLTFGRFRNIATYVGQMTLISDVVVHNVSPKLIPRSSFSVALLDKERVRIGSGILVIDELNASESAKLQFQCVSVGPPAVLSLLARNNGGVPASLKTVPMTVISVPAGASLKVDDKDEGLTPAKINVSVGSHQLELTKEGFAVATTTLDVAPDEAPGGSISVTLGGISNDTIELRDGSIIMGDVMSMTMDAVVISVNGQEQKLERNRVKKMFLVERIVNHPLPLPQKPAK